MKRLLVLLFALLLVFSVACTKNTEEDVLGEGGDNPTITDVTDTKNKDDEEDNAQVVLYYSDKDARGLCPEVRNVPSDKANDALFVATELFKGAESDELVNTIPANTKINSCVVSDGLCTLDLSSEFISKQGTANEELAIYSVVNTLCRLDGIDEVQFLIDGQKVMIFGSYIFDEPFSEDTSLVR